MRDKLREKPGHGREPSTLLQHGPGPAQHHRQVRHLPERRSNHSEYGCEAAKRHRTAPSARSEERRVGKTALLRKLMQISVNRAEAQLGQLLSQSIIYHLGSRMLLGRHHRLINAFSLLGVAAPFHRPLLNSNNSFY